MRIAVAGATGSVGTLTATTAAGHGDVVAISRSAGVDVFTGAGLAEALTGVDMVIDVLNAPSLDPTEAADFFDRTSRNLLAAEREAGVGHHVTLSIVNVDSVEGNGHYVGKRAQEAAVRGSSVPWTIVRATQFFDFPAMIAGWTAVDGTAVLPPILMQPVDARDVADQLVAAAVGPATRATLDVAGPETHDFVDMARRTLSARQVPLRLLAGWHGGVLDLSLSGEVLLPAPGARIGSRTFEAWLAEQTPA